MPLSSQHHRTASSNSVSSVPTSLLILAYTPPDTSFLDEATQDRTQQARKLAERPELRIVSRGGEELAADALTVSNFQSWGCNDYVLSEVDPEDHGESRAYIVLSPKDAIVVRPRDRRDHVAWLVERKRYEEALEEIEHLETMAAGAAGGEGEMGVDAAAIGQRYIEHLIGEGVLFCFIDLWRYRMWC